MARVGLSAGGGGGGTYEMTLDVEKEPAMKRAGRRTFQMGEIVTAKAQGNQA